jgi:hypothetical protein
VSIAAHLRRSMEKGVPMISRPSTPAARHALASRRRLQRR